MSDSPGKENHIPLEDFIEEAMEQNRKFIEYSIKKPRNFIQKWNRGDIIFKGKFSSGVTPKQDRPVIKDLKVRSGNKKRTHEEVEELDEDSGSQEQRKNPFLEITPQMKRKVRKCSFDDNNADMVLDFSSPTRNKRLI